MAVEQIDGLYLPHNQPLQRDNVDENLSRQYRLETYASRRVSSTEGGLTP